MGDHTTGLRTNHGGHVGWVHQCCWWCVPQQHGLHQAQGKDLAQLLQLLLDAKGGLHLQTAAGAPYQVGSRLVLLCTGGKDGADVSDAGPHPVTFTSDKPRPPVVIPTSLVLLPPLLLPPLLGGHGSWWRHCCCPGWTLHHFPARTWMHCPTQSSLICGQQEQGP